jgi:hypothetical protein
VQHFDTPVLYTAGFWKNFASPWLWDDATSTKCSELNAGNCRCLSICLQSVRKVAVIVVKGVVTIEFGKGQLLESRGRQQHVKPALAELHAMCNSCANTLSRALFVGQTLDSFKNSPLSSLGRDMCCALDGMPRLLLHALHTLSPTPSSPSTRVGERPCE